MYIPVLFAIIVYNFFRDEEQQTGAKRAKKRKQEPRQRQYCFKAKWLSDPDLKKCIELKERQAHCKFCLKIVIGTISHMRRHAKSVEHKKREAAAMQHPAISCIMQPKIVPHIRLLAEAELKLMMFLAEHNMPMLTMDHMSKLLSSVLPDSQLAKELKCGRTKSKMLLTDVIAPHTTRTLADNLKEIPFSLIIDESTDIGKVKCLAIIVRYLQANTVRDRFLKLVDVQDTTAKGLVHQVLETLRELEVPLKHMIGFAADNASVMMGSSGGVQALLKEQLPNLFVLGCVCHSFALCSEAACKKLPDGLEQLIRDMNGYFGKSAVRRKEFANVQKMWEVAPHRLLKLSQTRWLSLEVSPLKIIIHNCCFNYLV